MQIVPMSQQECGELLKRISMGRLACSLDDQPYIVPVSYAYEPGCIYIFATLGKKIEWMRKNPKVCLQADEIGNRSSWSSVVVNGKYLELRGPEYSSQKEHARELLGEDSEWWKTPLEERRSESSDLTIEPIFFRIDIESMSGLRALPEAQ